MNDCKKVKENIKNKKGYIWAKPIEYLFFKKINFLSETCNHDIKWWHFKMMKSVKQMSKKSQRNIKFFSCWNSIEMNEY
jgi:hypothetical protein